MNMIRSYKLLSINANAALSKTTNAIFEGTGTEVALTHSKEGIVWLYLFVYPS
jgi:hypothetical protein